MVYKSNAESLLCYKAHVSTDDILRTGYQPIPDLVTDYSDVMNKTQMEVNRNEMYAEQARMDPGSNKRYIILQESMSTRLFIYCISFGFLAAAVYQNLK